MALLTVDIWSDIVCPWCYIGKRRFEAALSRFEHRDDVDVLWHSFELDPAAPRVQSGRNAERLAEKYGMSVQEAEEPGTRRSFGKTDASILPSSVHPGSSLATHGCLWWIFGCLSRRHSRQPAAIPHTVGSCSE